MREKIVVNNIDEFIKEFIKPKLFNNCVYYIRTELIEVVISGKYIQFVDCKDAMKKGKTVRSYTFCRTDENHTPCHDFIDSCRMDDGVRVKRFVFELVSKTEVSEIDLSIFTKKVNVEISEKNSYDYFFPIRTKTVTSWKDITKRKVVHALLSEQVISAEVAYRYTDDYRADLANSCEGVKVDLLDLAAEIVSTHFVNNRSFHLHEDGADVLQITYCPYQNYAVDILIEK